MGKVHKTIRLEEETFEQVQALKREGESDNAAMLRIVEAGISSLEAAAQGGEEAAPVEGSNAALVQALTAHVASLTAEAETYREQLATKDRQIDALTALTDHAQQLHGMTEVKQLAEATTAPETGRTGFFEYIRNYWKG